MTPDQLGFNWGNLGDGHLWVESTDVYRTIQSGYSQLLGMASESEATIPKMTSKQEAVMKNGHGLPQFKVRNTD
jgi:hypothetical protein